MSKMFLYLYISASNRLAKKIYLMAAIIIKKKARSYGTLFVVSHFCDHVTECGNYSKLTIILRVR